MGNVYCVAHVQKFKKWSVIAFEKHLNRTSENPKNYDIDSTLTEQNVNLMDRQEKYNEFDFKGKYKTCLENNLDDYKVRKDAVAFFSVVVSASPEFFRNKTRDQVENYFEAAKDFLMDFYGPENCIGAYVHFDEVGNVDRSASPHMHFIVAPIKNRKLCCKNIITQSSLRKLQNELPLYLQARGYDVQRGIQNSPRYHIDTNDWKKSELKKEITQKEMQQSMQIEIKSEKKFFGGTTENVIVKANDLEKLMFVTEQALSFVRNNEELKREWAELKALGREMDRQEKEIILKMKEQQAAAEANLTESQRLEDQMSRLRKYEKVLEAQDKNVALQKLADDLAEQKEMLKKKEETIVERVTQRVSEVYRKLIDEEILKMSEQGAYAVECMKELKKTDAELWKEIVGRVGKKIKKDMSLKMKKSIEKELDNSAVKH